MAEHNCSGLLRLPQSGQILLEGLWWNPTLSTSVCVWANASKMEISTHTVFQSPSSNLILYTPYVTWTWKGSHFVHQTVCLRQGLTLMTERILSTLTPLPVLGELLLIELGDEGVGLPLWLILSTISRKNRYLTWLPSMSSDFIAYIFSLAFVNRSLWYSCLYSMKL